MLDTIIFHLELGTEAHIETCNGTRMEQFGQSKPESTEGEEVECPNADLHPRFAKSILLIDDDEAIRFLFKFALERGGYEVLTASNGREGLLLLSSAPRPCLILLDLMMPVMDGWKFLDEIAKQGQFTNIPIVVITAFPVDLSSLNAKEVLAKPIDLNHLLETVRRYCDSQD